MNNTMRTAGATGAEAGEDTDAADAEWVDDDDAQEAETPAEQRAHALAVILKGLAQVREILLELPVVGISDGEGGPPYFVTSLLDAFRTLEKATRAIAGERRR